MNALILPIANIAADESPEEFLRTFMPEIIERFDRCDSDCGNGRVSERLCELRLKRESIVAIHAIGDEKPAFENYLLSATTMSGRKVWVRAVADLHTAKRIKLQSGNGLLVEWYFLIRG